MNKVISHSDFITQVKVPLPFPLRWVNSYLIKGKNGYTLLDPGLHTEVAEDFWLETLKKLQIRFNDIEQIVLTHHHPDHYGLSGWFQERCNVEVFLSKEGYEQVEQMWKNEQPLTMKLYSLYVQHGMVPDIAKQMIPHMESFTPLVSPQPEVTFIKPGIDIRLGDDLYQTILTPGHAAGHICYYSPSQQIMFCGDQVIPQISPNVSYLPGDNDPNPLQSFLESLDQLLQLQVVKAYPGHRDPFTEFSARARELIEHHDSRLQHMLESINQPVTAYELCCSIFGNKLSIHQLRFAMSETLAHLVYLAEQGKAYPFEKEDLIMYSV